jgi:hypothetical protein
MSLGESGEIATVSARILLKEQIESRPVGFQEAILYPLLQRVKG